MQVLIILGLALASVCAELLEKVYPKDLPEGPRIEGRITSGYPAYPGKAPYTVGLSFVKNGSGGWWGGGTIIAHNWVVTAAHCTNGANFVTIYYGATWRIAAQYTHRVASNNFIQNQYWPNNNGNDISLIRTPHVDFWSMVNKVELPKFKDRNNKFVNWWAVACGWGRTHDASSQPDWLQCVDVQIMTNDECGRSYGTLPDGIICVRTPNGKSTCAGDSGGPLVTHDNPILVGVTSFVSAAGCKSGAPAGFTRITTHLDWIRQHTNVAYY